MPTSQNELKMDSSFKSPKPKKSPIGIKIKTFYQMINSWKKLHLKTEERPFQNKVFKKLNLYIYWRKLIWYLFFQYLENFENLRKKINLKKFRFFLIWEKKNWEKKFGINLLTTLTDTEVLEAEKRIKELQPLSHVPCLDLFQGLKAGLKAFIYFFI